MPFSFSAATAWAESGFFSASVALVKSVPAAASLPIAQYSLFDRPSPPMIVALTERSFSWRARRPPSGW